MSSSCLLSMQHHSDVSMNHLSLLEQADHIKDIRQAIHHGKIETAQHLLFQLPKHSNYIKEASFIVIRALLHSKQLQKALNVFKTTIHEYNAQHGPATLSALAYELVKLKQIHCNNMNSKQFSKDVEFALQSLGNHMTTKRFCHFHPMVALAMMDYILGIQCKNDMDILLKEMMSKLKENPQYYHILRKSYQMILRECEVQYDIQKAHFYLNQLFDSQIYPDVSLFLYAMKMTERLAGMKSCVQLFERYEDFIDKHPQHPILKPSLSIYHYMMTIYCKHGQMAHAEGLFNQLIDRGFTPVKKTFQILLLGYCRVRLPFIKETTSMQQALKVLGRMHAFGYVPDVQIYNILLNGFYHRNQTKKMWHYYHQMLRKKLKPNATTRLILTGGLAYDGQDQGDIAFVYQALLDELDSLSSGQHSAQQRIKIFKQMFFQYLRLDNPKKASQVFLRLLHDENEVPPLSMYTSLMAAHSPHQSRTVFDLLKSLDELHVKSDSFVFHVLMNLLLRTAPEKALELAHELKLRSIDSFSWIHELVFEAYVQLERFDEAKRTLFKDILGDAMIPSLATYNRLLKFIQNTPTLCEEKQQAKMIEIQKLNLKLTSQWIHASIEKKTLHVLNAEATEWIKILLSSLLSHGYPMHKDIYYPMMKHFMNQENTRDLLWLHQILLSQKIQVPNAIQFETFNYLLTRHQWKEFLDLFIGYFKNSKSHWLYFRKAFMYQMMHEQEPIKVFELLQKTLHAFQSSNNSMNELVMTDAFQWMTKDTIATMKCWHWLQREQLVTSQLLIVFIEHCIQVEEFNAIIDACTKSNHQILTSKTLTQLLTILHGNQLDDIAQTIELYWKQKNLETFPVI